MGSFRGRRGFTIVEVMMFLAISGLLAVGIMATATLGINNQRYKDAVNTFQSLVQREFVNTTQIFNNRENGKKCPDDSGNPSLRGAADCVIMGRLMAISTSGEIRSYNLVGRKEPNPAVSLDGSSSDAKIISAHRPVIDWGTVRTESLPWDTKLAGSKKKASIIILRSPRSGNVYSYVIREDLSNPGMAAGLNLFTAVLDVIDTNKKDRYICIDRSGWTTSPERAVMIAKWSNGPGGVSQVDTPDPEGGKCSE